VNLVIMKTHCIPLLCLIITTCLYAKQPANQPVKTDAAVEINALHLPYQSEFDAASADNEKRITELKSLYLEALDRLLAERSKAGDLDGALAVKAEREREDIQVPMGLELLKTMPVPLVKLRVAFEQRMKTSMEGANHRRNLASGKYLANLEALQKRLTVSGNIEQALFVKGEKERFIAGAATGKAPMNVAKTVAIPAELIGTWRFTFRQNGWNAQRTFKVDGTLIGSQNGEMPAVGSWKIIEDMVVLNYGGGGQDLMLLPLNPKEGKVIGKHGRELVAVKEEP